MKNWKEKRGSRALLSISLALELGWKAFPFDFLDSAFQIRIFQKFDFSLLRSYRIRNLNSIKLTDDNMNRSRGWIVIR